MNKLFKSIILLFAILQANAEYNSAMDRLTYEATHWFNAVSVMPEKDKVGKSEYVTASNELAGELSKSVNSTFSLVFLFKATADEGSEGEVYYGHRKMEQEEIDARYNEIIELSLVSACYNLLASDTLIPGNTRKTLDILTQAKQLKANATDDELIYHFEHAATVCLRALNNMITSTEDEGDDEDSESEDYSKEVFRILSVLKELAGKDHEEIETYIDSHAEDLVSDFVDNFKNLFAIFISSFHIDEVAAHPSRLTLDFAAMFSKLKETLIHRNITQELFELFLIDKDISIDALRVISDFAGKPKILLSFINKPPSNEIIAAVKANLMQNASEVFFDMAYVNDATTLGVMENSVNLKKLKIHTHQLPDTIIIPSKIVHNIDIKANKLGKDLSIQFPKEPNETDESVRIKIDIEYIDDDADINSILSRLLSSINQHYKNNKVHFEFSFEITRARNINIASALKRILGAKIKEIVFLESEYYKHTADFIDEDKVMHELDISIEKKKFRDIFNPLSVKVDLECRIDNTKKS